MADRRWLTKAQKRLLAAHAEHYSEMYEHIAEVSTDDLAALLSACRACTTSNCWWAEYAAAKYLIGEISAELYRRQRDEEAAADGAHPIAHRQAQWADDGGRVAA